MRRPSPAGARSMGEALDHTLERLGLGRVVERHDVFREWDERVGPQIARVARPYRVDGDTLLVRVESSPWINELSLRQAELLAAINQGRRSAIRRLIFKLDPEAKG